MSTVAEVIGEVNLNLAMVEDGQAFAYRQYLSQCNARLLSQGHTYLERLNFTAFYEALLEAHGDSLGEGGGNGNRWGVGFTAVLQMASLASPSRQQPAPAASPA